MLTTHQRRRATPAIHLFSALAFAASVFSASAQTAAGIEFIPAQPTSADTVYMKLQRTCENSTFLSQGYRVLNIGGRLRVEIDYRESNNCTDRNAPATSLMVELGKLPAGAYLIDVFELVQLSFGSAGYVTANNLRLVVNDHRPLKPAPAVFIDYSDHWWDASDPGSGLFIWQNRSDKVLAAWFTYSATGQPTWYTIQAGTWVSRTRYEGKLIQSSRPTTPPSPTSPIAQQVGTAVIDFTGEDSALSGRFTYKFDSAATEVTRNIRRFDK
mgnify:CR=1 FL=1